MSKPSHFVYGIYNSVHILWPTLPLKNNHHMTTDDLTLPLMNYDLMTTDDLRGMQ